MRKLTKRELRSFNEKNEKEDKYSLKEDVSDISYQRAINLVKDLKEGDLITIKGTTDYKEYLMKVTFPYTSSSREDYLGVAIVRESKGTSTFGVGGTLNFIKQENNRRGVEPNDVIYQRTLKQAPQYVEYIVVNNEKIELENY